MATLEPAESADGLMMVMDRRVRPVHGQLRQPASLRPKPLAAPVTMATCPEGSVSCALFGASAIVYFLRRPGAVK
jgi:hypothetical protein